MLTHPTLDLLYKLGLHGLAEGFQSLEGQPESAALAHAPVIDSTGPLMVIRL